MRVISGIRDPESRGCGAATGLVAHGLISCWIIPQQTSHHRRPHRRCPEHRSSSPPPAAHPRCRWARSHRCRRGIWGDFLLLCQRMILGAAVSTSLDGVPRPVPMLSATGTDAPGNPCSVYAGETVLLHMLSPRRPTKPLEVGYRCWQISCTPARGHGK
ncbi:hypothetical protein TcCL_ESM09948 [Trypanosoma cruzi]|nr:hypothetical protein TcCL_ESM09948 [Trypanosoma cruzi]